MKIRVTFILCALVGLLVVLGQSAWAGIITDFSNFSETGNLLGGSNSREQSFTPSGASVTIAHVSGGGAGQEMFLSDEFPTLAAGDRVSVDWEGDDSSVANEQWGLAITSGEVASGQNLIYWCWRDGGLLNLTVRPGAGGGSPGTISATPDTLFVERTASGWSFGSITDDAETYHYTDVTEVGGFTITADGSALGFFSDMRSTNPKTLSNLTIVPEPSTFTLAVIGLLGLLCLRRRK